MAMEEELCLVDSCTTIQSLGIQNIFRLLERIMKILLLSLAMVNK
jgi:hypothetical protein